MRIAGVLIAVALALALQTTLARFVVGGTAAIDLVLVAVVYIALTSGPVSGMLAGTVAGLIQDQLSTGVIGIGGLAKATVGFVVGALGQQFIDFLVSPAGQQDIAHYTIDGQQLFHPDANQPGA